MEPNCKCGRPSRPGHKTCEVCYKKNAAKMRARKAKWQEAGLCLTCGKQPPPDGRTVCITCNNKSKERFDRYEENGLCKKCGKQPPVDGIKFCSDCKSMYNQSSKTQRARKIAEGRCPACSSGKPMNSLTPRGLLCETCSFKSRATCSLKNRNLWKELRDKWIAQGGACYYTGVKINLWEAELDHITPLCLGGKNAIENTVWCKTEINQMKRGLPLDRFIELINQVAKHQGT